MFKKILVPYDGSKHAEIALNKAIFLSKLIKGSEVVILTVLEEVNTPTLVFDRKIRNYKTKIIVPVDGSEISYKALDAALFFSEKLGSNIIAIHVMEDIPVTNIESQKLLNDMLELSAVCKQQGENILSKCSETAKNKGLNVNTVLLKGNPASTILDFCKNGRYDVIIMGNRGIGKLKEIILGSVSSKILHNSACPVLLIK